jgi:hypothetical protein
VSSSERESGEGETGLGQFDRPRGLTGWVRPQRGGLGQANGPRPISKINSRFHFQFKFFQIKFKIQLNQLLELPLKVNFFSIINCTFD